MSSSESMPPPDYASGWNGNYDDVKADVENEVDKMVVAAAATVAEHFPEGISAEDAKKFLQGLAEKISPNP